MIVKNIVLSWLLTLHVAAIIAGIIYSMIKIN